MSHRFNDGYIKAESDGYIRLRKDGYNVLTSDGYLLTNISTQSSNGKITLDIGGSTKANLTSTGLRVGDSSVATEMLDILGNIKVSGVLKIGSTVAATGDIRFANNTTLLSARNAANSSDLTILYTDAGNNVTISNGGASPAYISLLANGTYRAVLNNIAEWVTAAGPTIFDVDLNGRFRFGSSRTTVSITQADNTTNGATAQNLTVQAQHATGTTSIGGSLVLTSGTGTTASGNINLQTGGALKVQIGPNGITYTVNSLQWLNTVSSPIISQADNTTSSATAQAITIQAQNATGTTSIGGALNLTSGTGTSTNGSVNVNVGGSAILTGTPTITTIKYQGSATNYVSINATTVEIGGSLNFAVSTATTATGGAQTLPANPDGFIIVNVGGVAKKIAIYNT